MRALVGLVMANIAIVLIVFTTLSMGQQKKFEDRTHWWNLARNELAAALNVRDNWNVAKNVIMFLGDGMGITINTASRIYKGQKQKMNGEEGYLAWERFPNAALLKTYTVDKQVPDSAATATAYLCGVKTRYYTLGLDSGVPLGDCATSRNPAHHAPSILQWAQEAGKDTGFVTTTRVTHATPAALYARSAHRRWECDSKLGREGVGCRDIADQLVSENPGRNIKVIMGGGRHSFGSAPGPSSAGSCVRADGRDLSKEWLKDKTERGFQARYVTNAGELASVNPDNTDFVLGLFADSHVPFEVDRRGGPQGTPSLTEMSLSALRMLQKSNDGFFLLVEGGRIDHALHDNKAKRAFEETVAMDEALTAVLKEIDLEETLVLVTADHSHVMTINGYPDRGNDILGMTGDLSEVDGKPYTTIMFTNGPGFSFAVEGANVSRTDPRAQNLQSLEYQSQTAVPMKPFDETHGGEDVAVWAAGPMSHLFHRTHEQHYVAHVMAYAACVGPNAGNKCERPAHASFTRGPKPPQPPAAAAAAASAVSVGQGIATAVSSTAGSSAAAAAAAVAGGLDGPRFPTLSPVLQQLIDTNEQKILESIGHDSDDGARFPLGFAGAATVLGGDDLTELLGKHAVDIPHSL